MCKLWLPPDSRLTTGKRRQSTDWNRAVPPFRRPAQLILSTPERSRTFHPVVLPLEGDLTPLAALQRLAGRLPGSILMHSGGEDSPQGRFSFLTADPVEWFTLPDVSAVASGARPQAFWPIDRHLRTFATPALPGLPPFQGGWAGLCAYEMGGLFERLPAPARDPFHLPALKFGLYDIVVAWDHHSGGSWIISQGLPETDPHLRRSRAEMRAAQFTGLLRQPPPELPPPPPPPPLAAPPDPAGWMRPVVAMGQRMFSSFSRAEYLSAVQQAVGLIHAGDVFQVNLAQQLWMPAIAAGLPLLEAMQRENAAPFSAWMDGGDWQLISASPERLFAIRGGWIESRPIKGTRPRDLSDPQADASAAAELLACDKDRAENTMIVDLMRNDLSQVCTDDSVQVTQWCGLESYASVHHLVSAVRGKLRGDPEAGQVFAAVFPGGSVTGAPRIRAMEIICGIEQQARGAYCGSLGWWGLDGSADFNILIRTVTAAGGWWQFPVGGGIVAESDPLREYDETWAKADGLLRAMKVLRESLP